MAPTRDIENKNMFCLFWSKQTSSRKFCLNLISAPEEASPMKLPDLSIQLFPSPARSTIRQQEDQRISANERKFKLAIGDYLDALYGNKMPRMYVAEKGSDLVMNVYILKDHCGPLMKLPFHQETMQCFVSLLFTTIIQRVLDVVEDPDLSIAKPDIIKRGEHCIATGRRAKCDEICSLLLGQVEDRIEKQLRAIPSSAIKVGDPLMWFGLGDARTRAAILFNVFADDSVKSIRLPRSMLEVAKLSRVEARRKSAALGTSEHFHELVEAHMNKCLDELYNEHEPVVYLGENGKDLVVNIPLHIGHAPLLSRSLIEFFFDAFMGSIAFYHFVYFERKCSQTDLEANLPMVKIIGNSLRHNFGRKATEQEIYSLLLKKKPIELAQIYENDALSKVLCMDI